jgi:uncharacterized membrane protein
MLGMSNLSGPVPRGVRLFFVVLTLATLALAVVGAVRGTWAVVAIAGALAVCNLGALWVTRSGAAAPATTADADTDRA